MLQQTFVRSQSWGFDPSRSMVSLLFPWLELGSGVRASFTPNPNSSLMIQSDSLGLDRQAPGTDPSPAASEKIESILMDCLCTTALKSLDVDTQQALLWHPDHFCRPETKATFVDCTMNHMFLSVYRGLQVWEEKQQFHLYHCWTCKQSRQHDTGQAGSQTQN